MFDIIIPAYDDHEKVAKTLVSIAMQTSRDLAKVYIVNNGSLGDYKEEIKQFKGILNIKEIKLKEKMNMGYVKDYALRKSDGVYVIFLEPGNQFFHCYVLAALSDYAKSNYDVVMGKYYYYNNNINDLFIVDNPYDYSEIHGKAFKRAFLDDNNIHFNYTNTCENDSFEGLVNNLAYNPIVIDDIITIVYQQDTDLLEYYMNFLYNRLWLIYQLENRNMERESILDIYINSYLYLYNEMNDKLFEKKYKKLFKYCGQFEKHLNDYNDILNDDYLLEMIKNFFSINDKAALYMVDDFNSFRERFNGKDEK